MTHREAAITFLRSVLDYIPARMMLSLLSGSISLGRIVSARRIWFETHIPGN
jgi:hypothetical protein